MDIKELILRFGKALRVLEGDSKIVNEEQINADVPIQKSDKIQMFEFAWNGQCGTELKTVKIGERIIHNPSLTQKIKELIKITDGERGMIVNQ